MRNHRFLILLLTLTAGVALLCGMRPAAQAQGILLPDIRPLPGPRPPRPFPIPPRPEQPFYVKNLKVKTVINDAVAETTVEQTFVNIGSFQGEATYLYPLPEGASPTSFSMTIGDKTLEPRILPKDEANQIYEGYVRRYRDPALLEYVGRSLVKISVFPIPPQGERTIRLRYTEVLKPENGLHKYVYPLSTSRFGAKPVGSATVSITLQTSSPIKNVYSPTHDLSVRHTEERTATASWEGSNDTSDRDLTLYYSTSNDDVGLSLLTYKSGDKDGYFMLLAAPRVSVPKDRILPKQVVFVLDRTGSMAGKKIEQARKSLLYCLDSLRPQDRFDLITFNESPDLLLRHMAAATPENITKAKHFVANIEASGGTNIDDALAAALNLLKDEDGQAKMVVFLTDGLPTVGEINIDTILQHVKERNGVVAQEENGAPVIRLSAARNRRAERAPARIFCFGLGYDVNVPFLDRLAALGRGDSDYVRPEEDVEAKVSDFFAKVASPVLSDLKVAFDGMETYDVYPKVLPDLFKGSQLVITGRFRGEGNGTVRLSGQTSGSSESFLLAAKSGEADGSNTYLPRIWAQRKIGYLIDQVRLSNNPAGNKEVLDEIVRLSKEYGIITEYTSFLVDEQEQQRLGLRGGALDSLSSDNSIIVRYRDEIARRATQFGINGAGVTNQSSRANDLKQSDKVASRYQSPNGSVGLGGGGLGGFGGGGQSGAGVAGPPAGLAAPGNYKYYDQGGLAGGRINGHTPLQGKAPGFQGDTGITDQLKDSGNAITLQAVGDRTFYLQANKVWQDHSYDPAKQHLVKIQAFSDAHFALIHAMPKLAAYSSVGDEVIIRIGANAIQIGKEGKETLTSGEVKQLTGK